MAEQIHEIMTQPPYTVPPETTLHEAAVIMRDKDIGDVLVTDGDSVLGILTDRDIVVRCVADGADCARSTARNAVSEHPAVVGPRDDVDDAVHIMRSNAVRRCRWSTAAAPWVWCHWVIWRWSATPRRYSPWSAGATATRERAVRALRALRSPSRGGVRTAVPRCRSRRHARRDLVGRAGGPGLVQLFLDVGQELPARVLGQPAPVGAQAAVLVLAGVAFAFAGAGPGIEDRGLQ